MAEYLFPFLEIENEEESENIEEIYTDIAWDFDKNIPILEGGDFVVVEGIEAVKSWAYRALQTQRAKHLAFTWDYGVDLESYVGKVLDTKEKINLTTEITDCLMQNKHITNVVDFEFKTEKRKVYINFRIITKYGDFEREVEI